MMVFKIVKNGMMNSPMGHMTPQGHMGGQMNSTGYMQQVNPPPNHQLPANQHNNNGDQSPNALSSPTAGVSNNACIRHGCTNPAVTSTEWEDEYCSNECVIGHCRDVFSSWVASNPNQSHPVVK